MIPSGTRMPVRLKHGLAAARTQLNPDEDYLRFQRQTVASIELFPGCDVFASSTTINRTLSFGEKPTTGIYPSRHFGEELLDQRVS